MGSAYQTKFEENLFTVHQLFIFIFLDQV